MKLAAILGALVLTLVLCYGSLMCCSLLFGTICGNSVWSSDSVGWAVKAMLLAGIVLPPAGGACLVYHAAKN